MAACVGYTFNSNFDGNGITARRNISTNVGSPNQGSFEATISVSVEKVAESVPSLEDVVMGNPLECDLLAESVDPDFGDVSTLEDTRFCLARRVSQCQPRVTLWPHPTHIAELEYVRTRTGFWVRNSGSHADFGVVLYIEEGMYSGGAGDKLS